MTQYREASRNIDGSATLTRSKEKRPYRFIGLTTQATVYDVVDDSLLMFDSLFDVTLSTDVRLTISGISKATVGEIRRTIRKTVD